MKTIAISKQTQLIIEELSSTDKTHAKIAEQFGLSVSRVSAIAKKHGIRRRKPRNASSLKTEYGTN